MSQTEMLQILSVCYFSETWAAKKNKVSVIELINTDGRSCHTACVRVVIRAGKCAVCRRFFYTMKLCFHLQELHISFEKKI